MRQTKHSQSDLKQLHQLRSGKDILKEGDYNECLRELFVRIKGTKFKTAITALASGRFEIINPESRKREILSSYSDQMYNMLKTIVRAQYAQISNDSWFLIAEKLKQDIEKEMVDNGFV